MTQITIFAMTAKGLAVVQEAIAINPRAIALVVGARDAAVQDDCYETIRHLCVAHGVPHAERTVAPPISTPWAIAASWRWMLHAASSTQLVVFHDSLLPRLRGFNPLVTALVNGDRQVGVTGLVASSEVDSGDIVAQTGVEIDYPITIAQAIEHLLPVYGSLTRRIIGAIVSKTPLQKKPQDHAAATYSLWRDEADYLIDWSRPATAIRRFIDAVGSPYRGAVSWMDDRRVRILGAEEQPDITIENRCPGKVLVLREGRPLVVCGQGLLLLTSVSDDAGATSVLPLKRVRVRFRIAPAQTIDTAD